MRTAPMLLAAFGLALSLTACTAGNNAGADGNGGAGNGKDGKIGVILPDTNSERWTDEDPTYMKKLFAAAKVSADIQNAQGDVDRFTQIADRMIDDKVAVLMIVSLDPTSGAAVIDKARRAGITTIDYDRLTLGGGADYYVSYDSVRIGELQGYGLAKCIDTRGLRDPVVAELNGAEDDNNATLYKQGYDSVLQPRYDAAEYIKGPDQWTPNWSTKQAGQVFTQMFGQRGNINAVLAANDALANAVIQVLRDHKLNGKVPVVGQDGTIDGLRNILLGDQCMTVYKPVAPEAQAAANLAVSIYMSNPVKVHGRIKDPESARYIPFLNLEPRPVYVNSIKELVADGNVNPNQLCVGPYAPLCQQYGIT